MLGRRLDERLERLLYEYEDGPKPKHYDDPRIIDSENFKTACTF